MKKSFIIMIAICFLFLLTGCPPTQIDLDKILHTDFENFNIEPISQYQDENDVIVLLIENKKIGELKNLYIQSNTQELLNVKAFGESLSVENIDNEEYYFLDIDGNHALHYNNFYLLLTYPKDTIFNDSYYEILVDSEIVLHSFDLLINYNENNPQEKENLRFFYDPSRSYQEKMIILPTFERIMQETIYKELYLPFCNKESISLSLQNIYYTNSDNFLVITDRDNKMRLIIRRSDYGITYGSQVKTAYYYHNIDYMIIESEEPSLIKRYSIDFYIEDSKLGKIQYSFQIERKNVEEVKEFIHTIQKFNQ